MEKVINKFVSLEKKISAEKGEFALFALLEREDSLNKWDVVLSASWFGENKKKTLDFVVKRMKAKLSSSELMTISRVVLLDPSDVFVANVNSVVNVTHGRAEFVHCVFNGLNIKHAFIITSQNLAQSCAEISSD